MTNARRAIGGLGVTLAVAAATGWFTPNRHLRLMRSAPAEDSTVYEAPTTIQLWFNQEPQLSVSRIVVHAAADTVALGPVEAGPDRSLVAAVTGPVAPAVYTVSWRTAGDDGHPIRRHFQFTVAAGGGR